MLKNSIHTELTDTLHLSEDNSGFWLYDETRGMNLAMRAKSERDAFVDALSYYQERTSTIGKAYYSMRDRVNFYINEFSNNDLLDL